jgi:hypothetical protein
LTLEQEMGLTLAAALRRQEEGVVVVVVVKTQEKEMSQMGV